MVFPVLNDPFARIIVDILPNLIIILLISDHVIVITGLPNIFPVFFIAKSLERTDEPCNCGCPRRDSRPRVSVCVMDTKQKMYMIRHDYVPIYRYMIIESIYLPNNPISNFSMHQQFNPWIIRTPREGCPYDLTEDLLSALGADCYEIRAILAVIIPTDTIRLSVW